MRYVKGHGLQTRSRIVEEASYGLRARGADGLSVVDLMKLAGLTHGGFYAHFESREALVVEAFVLAMDRRSPIGSTSLRNCRLRNASTPSFRDI